MTSFVLREAQPHEYATVGDVLEDAFTHGCWITESYRRGLHTIAQRAESSRVWVIENGNRELVAAVLTPRALRNGVSTFNILGVSSRGRGHSLGHRLVEHAIEQARELGAHSVAINSSPHMTFAHRLYYQHGFVRRYERETAVVDSGQRLFAFSLRLAPLSARNGRDADQALLEGVTTVTTTSSLPDYEIDELIRAISLRTGIESDPRDPALLSEIRRDLLDALPIVTNDSGTQAQREALIRLFFARLGFLDYQLGAGTRYLTGDTPSFEDVVLFSLLALFDVRLRGHFGWGAASIRDYPHLWRYARDLAQFRGFLPEDLKRSIGLVPDPDETHSSVDGLTTGESHNDLVAAWLIPAEEIATAS